MVAIGLLLGLIVTPLKAADPQDDCAYEASKEFMRRKLALQNRESSPVRSIDLTIAERRLEEEYCQRSARCVIPTTSPREFLNFSAAFAKCLRDEAVEKYELKPHN